MFHIHLCLYLNTTFSTWEIWSLGIDFVNMLLAALHCLLAALHCLLFSYFVNVHPMSGT